MPIFAVWGPLTKIILNDKYYAPGVAAHMFLVISQCVMLALSYSEAKRQREELARKTEFYHKMAHDLLTPMTVVSTSIQVAAFKSDEAPELLHDSQVEIMKMADMINNALKEDDNQ
jgi:signal transduction histidine kinase